MSDVKVTIQLKSPVGYDELDAIMIERGWLNRLIDRVLIPSNESIIQGPRIIYETYAPPAPRRNNLGLTGVRVRRDLLITTSCDYSMDTYHMLTVPIPTSAFSNYLRVTLTREPGSTIHFSSSLYTLIIVDRERRYLHSVVCNMREEPPSIQLIVPYEAPPVGERAFQLGFSVYRQTAGLMILDDQEVTKLQTRSYDEFITTKRTYRLRNVGNSLILLGPEARPRPGISPGLAPAA